MKRRCSHCSTWFQANTSVQIYCKDLWCIKERNLKSARRQLDIIKAAGGYFQHRANVMARDIQRTCRSCGIDFSTSNEKRLYCKTSCRMKCNSRTRILKQKQRRAGIKYASV